MTLPSADRDLLICLPSSAVMPSAAVCAAKHRVRCQQQQHVHSVFEGLHPRFKLDTGTPSITAWTVTTWTLFWRSLPARSTRQSFENRCCPSAKVRVTCRCSTQCERDDPAAKSTVVTACGRGAHMSAFR